MAHSIDPHVAYTLDSRLSNKADDLDEDELFDSLDNDSTAENLREQRLQQLHEELTRAKHLQSRDYGAHTEIKDEKALMDITTNTRCCVVHFFKPDFAKCGMMDSMLEALAPKHFDARFLKINVENAPFLVTKLRIQVLPCVLAFVDGVSADRIIGFEGLGYSPDTFTARDLEARLLQAGVLTRAKVLGDECTSSEQRRQNRPSKKTIDNDDDWD